MVFDLLRKGGNALMRGSSALLLAATLSSCSPQNIEPTFCKTDIECLEDKICKDNTCVDPQTNVFNPSPEKQPSLSLETTTNNDGEGYFIDQIEQNEPVTITILDYDTNTPISDINLAFENHQGLKVYTASDSSGLYSPSRLFVPHNSTHVMKMRKTEKGIFQIVKYGSEKEGFKLCFIIKS